MKDEPGDLEVVDSMYSIANPAYLSPGLRRGHPFRQRLAWLLDAFRFVARQRLIFACVLGAGIVLSLLLLKILPKTYQAASRVLIVTANTGRDPTVTSVDLPSVATSSEVLTRVARRLKLPMDLPQLKANVKASVKTKSSIMDIEYRDKVPERAVAVPNAIADELSAYYDQISGNGADVTIQKYDRALAAAETRLHSIEKALSAQMKRHPLVQSEKALDDVTARLDDLTGQQKLARAALASDQAQRAAAVKDAEIQSKIVRYEKLQNDLAYRNLATGSAKDEADLVFQKAQYTEDYPGLRVLEKKVHAERQMSSAREQSTLNSPTAFSTTEAAAAIDIRKIDAAIGGDQAKLGAIDGLVASTRAKLNDTLTVGVVEERLKLQHEAAKADYLALSSRRAAAIANRAESLSLGSVVVVDRAVRADTAVVGLGRAMLGVMLFLFVIAVALGAAYVVDSLDPYLVRADQIERLYGVPLVALVESKS